MANFNTLREALLLNPGTYGATLRSVSAAPSKSKPGAVNVSVGFNVISSSGNTVPVWDLLPDVDAQDNPGKVFWKYDQYMKAFGLTHKEKEFNSQSFIDLLSTAMDNATEVLVDVGVEKSDGYPPRNRITKVTVMPDDTTLVSMARADTYDSDTDAPLSPDRNTATGEQSLAADSDVSAV
jgi:hypothetical protein